MKVAEWMSRHAPGPVLVLLRPLYSIYNSAITSVVAVADSLRLVGPDTVYEEDYYSSRTEEPWRSDARNIARAIDEYFAPSSVIDFGCAVGSHLEPFYEDGIDIKGVDGNSDALKHAVIPPEYIELHDLRDPYEPERRYDVALCFEVAEHLPPRSSDHLVDTLTTSSGTIVMTAATPGQGGVHHINEQPPEYWHEKFAARGFAFDPEATAVLRGTISVAHTTWILDNLMVFRASAD